MEDPCEITILSVVTFLENNGGRCTNQELVSHFRKLLNDPFRKVDFRLQFKDIVNTIASVHEEHGLKYICLKNQYYSESCDRFTSEQVKSSTASENHQYPQSYQPYWRYRLSFNTNSIPTAPLPATVLAQVTSNEEHSAMPVLQNASLHQGIRRKSLQDQELKKGACYEGYTRQTRSRSKSLYQIPSPTVRSSLNYVQRQPSFSGSDKPSDAVLNNNNTSFSVQSLPARSYNILKRANSKVASDSSYRSCLNSIASKSSTKRPSPMCLSDENLDSLLSINPIDEVFGDTNHASVVSPSSVNNDPCKNVNSVTSTPFATGEDIPREYNDSFEMQNSSEFQQKEIPLKVNPEWEKLHLLSCRVNGSELNEVPLHTSNKIDPNEQVYLRSDSMANIELNPSYSNTLLNPKLKKTRLHSGSTSIPVLEEVHLHSNDTIAQNVQEIRRHSDNATTTAKLEEIRVQSGSVRERAQMIDTIVAAISTSAGPPIDASPRKSSLRATKNHHVEKIIPEGNASIVSLDSKLRRQWFVKAAKADYHGLVSLLKKEPMLAGIRDIASGFTALHWAAKQGNAEVVKLIAGTHKVSPNLKSNGGYTCIHLATLYKHKTIVDLLLKTYGANPTIRDNSGKRADQYPENYVSFTVGIIRKPPRPAAVTAASSSSLDHIEIPANGKRILVRPADDPPPSFIRIGSLNLKVTRTMGVFAGVRGSSVRLKTWSSTDSVTETWSAETNEKILVPKKKKSKKKRMDVSSVRSGTSKQDSDSDSAYGFNP